MSFRVRVLALVALVALVATGATAWLTLRQASSQLTAIVSADQRQTSTIVDSLLDHARSHNGWDGVQPVVETLSQQTGQRIRLSTPAGVTVVDSDALAGGPVRPAPGPTLVLDPRLPPRITAVDDPTVTARQLAVHVLGYRSKIDMIECLVAAADPPSVAVVGGELLVTPATLPAPPECLPRDRLSQADLAAMVDRLMCKATPGQDLVTCFEQRYAEVVAEFAPEPLNLQLGAVDAVPAGLAAAPVVTAAGAVLLAVFAGAWLLSRRVLRPIRALTAAATRVGVGDLDQRVPVGGGDELASLGRTFNRMADSLRASEERQRRLIADVAHELRTPLSNLRGYLEALRDGVMAPDPALLHSLHEEALLQQRIVDDLQDLALAEAGQLAYQRGPVDLTELAQTCVTAHLPAARTAGVELGRAPSAARPVVHGDADRLRQAVGNLVANALHATPPGGTVTVSIVEQDGVAQLQVADTGVGIAAADLPHIFDRFWRADAARGHGSRSNRSGGAGLGLAIARQIVLDHGGTIDVTSEPGRGTVFVVRLPLAPDPRAPER